jgi:hypothetical protein
LSIGMVKVMLADLYLQVCIFIVCLLLISPQLEKLFS